MGPTGAGCKLGNISDAQGKRIAAPCPYFFVGPLQAGLVFAQQLKRQIPLPGRGVKAETDPCLPVVFGKRARQDMANNPLALPMQQDKGSRLEAVPT